MRKYAVILPALLLVGCGKAADGYRLYRTSVAGTAPVHVATFDSADVMAGGNHENCELARSLFQAQPGISVTFYCAPME